MLTLTRKPYIEDSSEDSSQIELHTKDGLVVIELLSSKNGQAKIGIDAPESVLILRSELAGN
ncbi:carbon storage regulator [Agaribacterium sp. ZY112]|uniref:carbon storage regulator n=1 Tax=Agaribacterium sp. ZY112 TaxID=3233574 RepID=UPI0035250A11